jgi:histidine ammonia-lyase
VVREHVPVLERDRALAPDIETISDMIEREVLVAGVRVRLPDLA